VNGLPNIAQVAQALEERLKSCRLQGPRIERKEAEPRDILGRLGLRGEWPCSCRTERTEKFAPLHVRPAVQEKA
jgi:hypothetical protein